MKLLLFFAFLSLLWLPVSGQTKWTEVDLQINGVGIASSYQNVIGKFGKPLRSERTRIEASRACSGVAETHLTLYYPGLEILLIGDGQGRDLSASSIEITSLKWEIAPGIRIGAALKDVRATFGKPLDGADESTISYTTKDNLGTANFYFRNNKLVKVTMSETLC